MSSKEIEDKEITWKVLDDIRVYGTVIRASSISNLKYSPERFMHFVLKDGDRTMYLIS